ncbi:unnamed protein product [Lathyrus oleraceus]
MAQVLIFVYALVIFIFLFLVETTKVSANPCKSVEDCPEVREHIAKCIDGVCDYWPDPDF